MKNPALTEEIFQERLYMENKTKEEALMEDYDFHFREDFAKLWRFFSFIAAPVPPPYTEWEKSKCFTTAECMKEKLPKWFGHECTFLSENLFRVLKGQKYRPDDQTL